MDQKETRRRACAKFADALFQLIEVSQSPLKSDPFQHADSVPSNRPVARSMVAGDTNREKEIESGSPGQRRIYVYMAGSQGLGEMARTCGPKIRSALGMSDEPYIAKVGTTTLDLPSRLRQIGQDRYGAAVRTDAGVVVQPGFSSWVAHAIAISRPSQDDAISILTRAIAIDLPVGLTRRAFDTALHRQLRDRSLSALPAGTVDRRYVVYDLVAERISVAKEFYALCPYNAGDADRLLEAVERILTSYRKRQR